jgi:hypothetical protein
VSTIRRFSSPLASSFGSQASNKSQLAHIENSAAAGSGGAGTGADPKKALSPRSEAHQEEEEASEEEEDTSKSVDRGGRAKKRRCNKRASFFLSGREEVQAAARGGASASRGDNEDEEGVVKEKDEENLGEDYYSLEDFVGDADVETGDGEGREDEDKQVGFENTQGSGSASSDVVISKDGGDGVKNDVDEVEIEGRDEEFDRKIIQCQHEKELLEKGLALQPPGRRDKAKKWAALEGEIAELRKQADFFKVGSERVDDSDGDRSKDFGMTSSSSSSSPSSSVPLSSSSSGSSSSSSSFSNHDTSQEQYNNTIPTCSEHQQDEPRASELVGSSSSFGSTAAAVLVGAGAVAHGGGQGIVIQVPKKRRSRHESLHKIS